MRVKNWEIELFNSIVRHSQGGFQWGKSDCVMFAWNVRNDLLGKKDAPPWPVRYKTARGALLALKRYCGDRTLAEAVSDTLGQDHLPVTQARRGDVMAYVFDEADEDGFTERLGICVGKTTILLAEEGIVHGDTYEMDYCWRTE